MMEELPHPLLLRPHGPPTSCLPASSSLGLQTRYCVLQRDGLLPPLPSYSKFAPPQQRQTDKETISALPSCMNHSVETVSSVGNGGCDFGLCFRGSQTWRGREEAQRGQGQPVSPLFRAQVPPSPVLISTMT